MSDNPKIIPFHKIGHIYGSEGTKRAEQPLV